MRILLSEEESAAYVVAARDSKKPVSFEELRDELAKRLKDVSKPDKFPQFSDYRAAALAFIVQLIDRIPEIAEEMRARK